MSKHSNTLKAIRHEPTKGNIAWRDIESLIRHLGAEVVEGSGSRVKFILRERAAIFHRPHPSPATKKGTVRAVRDFLEGIEL